MKIAHKALQCLMIALALVSVAWVPTWAEAQHSAPALSAPKLLLEPL
jgi:hypothetical protein